MVKVGIFGSVQKMTSRIDDNFVGSGRFFGGFCRGFGGHFRRKFPDFGPPKTKPIVFFKNAHALTLPTTPISHAQKWPHKIHLLDTPPPPRVSGPPGTGSRILRISPRHRENPGFPHISRYVQKHISQCPTIKSKISMANINIL